MLNALMRDLKLWSGSQRASPVVTGVPTRHDEAGALQQRMDMWEARRRGKSC